MPDGLIVFELEEFKQLRKVMDTLAMWQASEIKLFKLLKKQGFGICFKVDDIKVIDAVTTTIELCGGTLLCHPGIRGQEV